MDWLGTVRIRSYNASRIFLCRRRASKFRVHAEIAETNLAALIRRRKTSPWLVASMVSANFSKYKDGSNPQQRPLVAYGGNTCAEPKSMPSSESLNQPREQKWEPARKEISESLVRARIVQLPPMRW